MFTIKSIISFIRQFKKTLHVKVIMVAKQMYKGEILIGGTYSLARLTIDKIIVYISLSLVQFKNINI